MNPISAVHGEVVLFNNKRFHLVEPWKLNVTRATYSVRLIPLYDLGLIPPSTVVNEAPCNRFIIDGCRGTLESVDWDKKLPSFVPVPF